MAEPVGHAPIYEDEHGLYVFICALCGQPLPDERSACHSGYHVGPANTGKVGYAVKSHTLVLMHRDR